MSASRDARRQLERENAKWPIALQEIPREEWPSVSPGRIRIWRSRFWLVQAFHATAPAFVRLSINRTTMTGDRWDDGISWDDMQSIKNELGFAGYDAVEIYPRAVDVVNVANMRHLWVLTDLLPFGWRHTDRAK